jgi:hypothetical protein
MILAASSYPLLNLMWTFFIFFAFVAWFMLLFRVFADLFRRKDIGGWAKTGWTLFVIFLPFLGVFVYLIAEGGKMADRDQEQAQAVQQQTDDYIRSVAAADGQTDNGHSSIDDISRGKQLLDSGAITEEEYAEIKRQALV